MFSCWPQIGQNQPSGGGANEPQAFLGRLQPAVVVDQMRE